MTTKEIKKTAIESLYEALQGVELENYITTIKVDKVRNITAKDLAQMIKEIDDANEATRKANFEELKKAFSVWFKNYTFASVQEKHLFVKSFNRAKKVTNRFQITFTKETDGTLDSYNDGEYFGKTSTMTAAGLRTSYNSAAIANEGIRKERTKNKLFSLISDIAQKTGKSYEEVAAYAPAQLKAFAQLLGISAA